MLTGKIGWKELDNRQISAFCVSGIRRTLFQMYDLLDKNRTLKFFWSKILMATSKVSHTARLKSTGA